MRATPLRAAAVGLGMLTLSISGLGCGDSYNNSSADKQTAIKPGVVDTGDFFFKPATAELKMGSSLTWTNSGAAPHTVKGDGFQSRQIDPGQSFSHRFAKAGTFKYVCTLHPSLMKGTAVVK